MCASPFVSECTCVHEHLCACACGSVLARKIRVSLYGPVWVRMRVHCESIRSYLLTVVCMCPSVSAYVNMSVCMPIFVYSDECERTVPVWVLVQSCLTAWVRKSACVRVCPCTCVFEGVYLRVWYLRMRTYEMWMLSYLRTYQHVWLVRVRERVICGSIHSYGCVHVSKRIWENLHKCSLYHVPKMVKILFEGTPLPQGGSHLIGHNIYKNARVQSKTTLRHRFRKKSIFLMEI